MINLTDGKVTEEVYDEAFLRKYLGGTALGVKLLYDEVPRDIGRRAVNLMRAFNLQTGLSAEHDRPSFRYGSTPVDGPTEGISIQPHWDKMLRNYYERMGWVPETGVPTKETLERLGISTVWGDL